MKLLAEIRCLARLRRLALEGFFYAPGGLPMPYPRMVVERRGEDGGDMREFREEENRDALEFAHGPMDG